MRGELKPGYKQTEVGVIPEEWVINRIIECADYVDYRGKTPTKTSSGVLLVTAKNIRAGFIDYEVSQEYIAESEYESAMRRGKPCIGDVLITTEAPLGMVALVDRDDIALAQRVIKYRGKSNKVYSKYLNFYFLSPKFQTLLDENSSGSTAKGIKGSVLHQLPVILPPLPEQEAIAEVLSDADALIESLEQLVAKKRQIKQGAMQELLTGKKRLPWFRGEWEVKRVGEFTDCTAGGTPSTKVLEYWGGSIRWMNSGELHLKMVAEVEGCITDEGLRNSSAKMIPEKCVLIGLAGQGKTRGTVAMNLVYLCTNQSIAAIFPNATFASKYLYYNLDSRYEELRELSTGEGGRGGLNLAIIRSLLVSLPSLPEQTAIAAILSDIDAEIAAMEKKLAKAHQLKQGIMQGLLTGKTRLVEIAK